MTVRIAIGDLQATIDGGIWHCRDAQLRRTLQRLDDYPIGHYTPDRDLSLAELAVQEIGGEIVEADVPEYTGDTRGIDA